MSQGIDLTSPALRYEPMVLIFVATVMGIVWDRIFPLSILVWQIDCCALLLLWCILWILKQSQLSSLALLCAVMSVSGMWHHAQWHTVPADHLVAQSSEETKPVCLEATITRSPRIVPAPPSTPLRPFPIGDRSLCEVKILRVRHGASWKPATGRARCMIDGHVLRLQAGDVVRIFAQYERPTPQMNPGEFDFADFERSEGRYLSLATELPDCLQLKTTGSWWNWNRWLEQVRWQGHLQLQKYLSKGRAPLAVAVMLGEREFLDSDRNERFLVTGTVHLLAISGLNLGILVYGFWMFGHLGWLSRRGTLLAAMIFAISYALLTDAEPPVLRAAVLIVVFCLARWSGRPISSWHVLSIAALVVILWNPASVFHVGAQLSFLAVAVLTWFRHWFVWKLPDDPLKRLIAQTRPWYVKTFKYICFLFWQIVLCGAVVWIFSLPLVWYRYNLISPIGLGLNPLVWLPMTCALFSGFLVLVLGWLPLVGVICGTICDVSLASLETIITYGQPFPGGYTWLPAPNFWLVLLFYVALGIYACFPYFRCSRAWCLAGMLCWGMLASYSAIPIQGMKSQPLTATFVSVGHGAAVMLELPNGRVLLYDCGRLGSPLSGARPIASVLWSRGRTHIDAVIVSHADSDHYNALPELLERFSIGTVYVSPVMWDEMSPGLAAVKQAIEQHGVPPKTLQAGDELRTATTTRIQVLHPPRKGVLGTDNANSLVLLVSQGTHKLLLSGDLEDRGLNDLLLEEPIRCNVVLAPHHGSMRSNPAGFSAWSRPEYVVISGGQADATGAAQVEATFAKNGAKVFNTFESGAVAFQFLENAIEATPFRNTE